VVFLFRELLFFIGKAIFVGSIIWVDSQLYKNPHRGSEELPTQEEWREAILNKKNSRPNPIKATTYLAKISTASQPVKITANNGKDYLVKGLQNNRMIVNEQVVGVLGELLGAPVPSPTLIDLPDALIKTQNEMSHMPPGVSHGSPWVSDCSDRDNHVKHTDLPENKPRFTALAVLYSWVHGNDKQWIYSNNSPYLVYSVDHGHFFPGGPEWKVNDLKNNLNVQIDPIFNSCGFTSEDFKPFYAKLGTSKHEMIAEAVARPPDSWSIDDDERIELAIYLEERCEKLLQLLGKTS